MVEMFIILLRLKKLEEKMKQLLNNKPIRTLVYIVLVAVFLVGVIGVTSVAAKSSIPGDALYTLKTTLERSQFDLSQDAGNRAQLKIEFAERRLDEITSLVNEGRFSEIDNTVLAFESAINGALVELESVAKSDPTRAGSLNIEISNALSKYAQVLTTLAATVPATIQLEVNRALDSTMLADSLEFPSDDDLTDDMSDDNDSYDDDMDSSDDSYDDMDSSYDDSSDDDMSIGDDDSYDDMDNSYDDSSDDDMSIGDDDSSDDDMSIGDDDSSDDDHSSSSNDDDSSDDSNDDSSSNNDDSYDDDSSDDDHSGEDDSSDGYDN